MIKKPSKSSTIGSQLEDHPAIDELVKCFTTLSNVRRRASQLVHSCSRSRPSVFHSSNKESKNLYFLNESVAAGKGLLISQINDLYSSTGDNMYGGCFLFRIWARVSTRLNQAIMVAPGMSQYREISMNLFSNAEFLHSTMNELISGNRMMIRSVYQSIYTYELEKTCERRPSGKLMRTSKLPCDRLRDLVRIVEHLHQQNRQLGSLELQPTSDTMDELQLEYDSPFEQNLLNLQKNMITRNRLVSTTIDRYACEYYALLERNPQTSRSSEESVIARQLPPMNWNDDKHECSQVRTLEQHESMAFLKDKVRSSTKVQQQQIANPAVETKQSRFSNKAVKKKHLRKRQRNYDGLANSRNKTELNFNRPRLEFITTVKLTHDPINVRNRQQVLEGSSPLCSAIGSLQPTRPNSSESLRTLLVTSVSNQPTTCSSQTKLVDNLQRFRGRLHGFNSRKLSVLSSTLVLGKSIPSSTQKLFELQQSPPSGLEIVVSNSKNLHLKMLGYSGEQQLGYREFTSMNEQRKLSRKQ